jgi:hypothetical protein
LARAVLDELLRLGVVLLEDNMVSLNKNAFILEKDFEDLLYYLGCNLHDHIAVSSHNILGNKPSMLERSVSYTALSENSVLKREEYARASAMEILIDLNKKALTLSKEDERNKDNKHKMNFGVYYLRETHD